MTKNPTKTLADKIRKRYKRHYSFQDLTAFITKNVWETYEKASKKDGRKDWPGWLVKFEDVAKPSATVNTTFRDGVTTIHWPKNDDYGNFDVTVWFEQQGFENIESNHQKGFRIKF